MDFNFFENNQPNGCEFLKIIGFEIPVRFKNILNNEYFKNEAEFYRRLEELINIHTSYYLFPNDICFFYPKVEESVATKEFTCYLSGAIIKPGEQYYCYRPLLENISQNKVYTVKTNIIASIGYYDLFPSTLFEFEEWCQKLDQNYYRSDDKIDFYAFSSIAGTNALDLRLLEKNPSKRKRRENLKKFRKLQIQLNELMNILPFSINKEDTQKKIDKIKRKMKQLEFDK